MTTRTLTSVPFSALADDVRDHELAIVQTSIDRVPARYRPARCAELTGCDQPATLITIAATQVTDDGNGNAGINFARVDGEILRIPACDTHRIEASHDLYFALTGRTRPDGIRAFDLPAQHTHWEAP